MVDSAATRTSRLDVAYQYIHDQLTRGDLQPGEKLSRRKLAEEIGVSSTVVQQALNRLEQAGLVECRAQSGTYVRELTAHEFTDLYDLRELIEPFAAERAALRITAAQLKTLEQSCAQYRKHESRISSDKSEKEFWQIHRDIVREEQVFHGTILLAAGIDLLTTMSQSMQVLVQIRPDQALGTHLGCADVACQHEEILAALKKHDPKLARQRMFDHVHRRREVLEQSLRKS